VNALEITKRPYRRQFWSWPQKGFGEIASTVPFAPDPFSKDVLEADFRPPSLRVHPGHNFRVARHPREERFTTA
jgi:hypothetical protein